MAPITIQLQSRSGKTLATLQVDSEVSFVVTVLPDLVFGFVFCPANTRQTSRLFYAPVHYRTLLQH